MSFRYALCSEVYKLPVEETLRRVSAIGFDGLEVAPFTIAESVDDISPARRAEIRRVAEGEGVEIAGLHWLLVSPKGLHVTTPDAKVRRRTSEYLVSLVHCSADLGGKALVLGSPKQRSLEPGDDPAAARERAAECLRPVADAARDRSARFLLEPLSPLETNFMNTVEDALSLLSLIDRPEIGYMLDCKAASSMPDGVMGTIARHGRRAGHFHANEPGGLGPGMGQVDFRPILAALRESGYSGWVSTEPFQYEPDPDTVARVALETLRAAAEG